MARRAATSGSLPSGFEPVEFFKAHENGVKGTGRDSRGLRESVAVVPVGGAVEERVEEREGLWGDAEAEAHELSLYM